MKNSSFTKITLIIVFFMIFYSCNSVKRLQDDEYLLKENTIFVNDKKSKDIELQTYLRQRPNSKVLGMPISLYLYNKYNPLFEDNYENWVALHPKTSDFITAVFSKKQIKPVFKFQKNYNNFFKKNGETPVIVDSKKTKKSITTLEKYYNNKGYFDAIVTTNELKKRKKRKHINYLITTKDPYFLDSIKTKIESIVLENLYEKNKANSFLKKGAQFNTSNFSKEQLRLTKLFRNSGIYNFGKDYIRFDVDISDSTLHHNKVLLKINNQTIENNDSIYGKPFQVKRVKNINIYTDYSFNTKDKAYTDSLSYNGYTFFSHKKSRFNVRHLSSAIDIKPNGIYKDEERINTRQYLNDLKVFRSPITINYKENSDESLTANILLTPLKRFGASADLDFTHSNIKPFGVLGKFALINRNIFKGSEIFELSFQGSFLNVAEDTSDPKFNLFGLTAWEIGANTSLKIPRIFFPIKTSRLIPKKMRPNTNIGISLSFQKNIGLDRQNITGNITYNWATTKSKKHQFDLLNVQYINNVNSSNYFEVFGTEFKKLSNVALTIVDNNTMNAQGQITNITGYINYVLNPFNNFVNTDFTNFKTVQRIQERQSIITEDILVPVMSYSFTYNNKKGINDKRFSFFKVKLISAGSITNAFTKNKNQRKKELFGLPVAQYIKAEVEYKKYWHLSSDNHAVFRTFIGAAVPFGNATSIPFSRSYRAGGSNDIRAWKTFDLGPGSSLSNLDFNIGNLKFISNLEYRFKVLNNLHSALFIDAGNVWDITNSNLVSEKSKFKNWESLQDIAVGSGIGMRYDLSFLILRIDLGFKTYEPYLDTNKWFRNYNIKHSVFNFGINYPF